MPGRVLKENQCFLDGRYYKLAGPVRRVLVSRLPEKVTVGEYSEASNPILSTITWSNLQGIGREVMRPNDPANFAFLSDADMSFPGQIVLGPAATVQTWDAQTSASACRVVGLAQLGASTTLYAALTSSQNGASQPSPIVVSNFTTPVRTLPAAPLQIVSGQLSTSAVVVVPTGAAVDYSSNPGSSAAWSQNTTDISYVAFFRNLLWGLSTAGPFYFTADLSAAWTQLTVLSSVFTPYGLLVAPRADGEKSLYIVTDRGLLIYDAENEEILTTALIRPIRPVNGIIPHTVWRDSIYIASGSVVYEFTAGAVTTVRTLTPFPEGVPPEYNVPIRALNGDFHYLWALASSTTVGTRQMLMRWNSQSWEMLNTGTPTTGAEDLATLHSRYDGSVELMELWFSGLSTGGTPPTGRFRTAADVTRPQAQSTLPNFVYNGSTDASIVLPWVQREGNQDWLALEGLVDSDNPTTSQRVELYYGLNFSTAWTSMGSNSTTGEKAFQFPVTGDQVGVAFRAIRLRARLQTDAGGSSRSPVLHKVVLAYRRNIRPLWGYEVTLDVTEESGGRMNQEQRAALEAVVASGTLVEFAYRDEASVFVTALQPQASERTGREEGGVYRLLLAEAI